MSAQETLVKTIIDNCDELIESNWALVSTGLYKGWIALVRENYVLTLALIIPFGIMCIGEVIIAAGLRILKWLIVFILNLRHLTFSQQTILGITLSALLVIGIIYAIVKYSGIAS